jgi:hypothetical protein
MLIALDLGETGLILTSQIRHKKLCSRKDGDCYGAVRPPLSLNGEERQMARV